MANDETSNGNSEPPGHVNPSSSVEHSHPAQESGKGQQRPDQQENKTFWLWRRKTLISLGLLFNLVLVVIYVSQVYFMQEQWDTMKAQVEEMRKSSTDTKVAAEAAKSSADTAEKSLELSHRPWVLGTHEIDTPLTFLENGHVVLVLKETLQNSGVSAAINLGSWADLVPLGPREEWDVALARQAQYCEQHRLWKEEDRSSLSGFILFPKQERSTTKAMGLSPADLTKTVAASTDPDKRVAFAIVGCIWYRTLFEPKSAPAHQTRFAYLLGKEIGPPEGTLAALDSGIAIGTQPMIEPKGTPEGLRLISSYFGNFAD